LIVSLSLLAIVAALLGTWAVKGSGGGTPTSSASHPGAPTATSPPAPSTAQAGQGPAAATVPTTTAPAAPPTTSVPAAGTGPSLTTLDPASGVPGQILVIEGTDLLSPSGQITAHFGTATATVACPAQSSCLVMVPPNTAAAASVPFTVTTDTGTSNALTFSYA
jgi:hypothetical protein